MQLMRLTVSALALMSSTVVAQERREVAAHVHGAGKLSIAIEGKQVAIELSAPAMDILGFERQPVTPAEAQTLAAARDTLGQASKLVEFPAEAGCVASPANVVFNAPNAPAAANAPPSGQAAATGEASASEHADFDVDIAMTCAAPDKLTSMRVTLFKSFPATQVVSVTVVGDQSRTFEATPIKSDLALK